MHGYLCWANAEITLSRICCQTPIKWILVSLWEFGLKRFTLCTRSSQPLVVGWNKEEGITHWLLTNPGLLPPCSSVVKNGYEFWHYISALIKLEKTFTKYSVRSEKNFCRYNTGQEKILQRHQLPPALWDQTSVGQPPGLCPESESDPNKTD